jgi:hypothetical protein
MDMKIQIKIAKGDCLKSPSAVMDVFKRATLV